MLHSDNSLVHKYLDEKQDVESATPKSTRVFFINSLIHYNIGQFHEDQLFTKHNSMITSFNS